MTQQDEDGKEFVSDWLTAGQIKDLYKDEAVAQALVEEKSRSPSTWKPHPDIPHILEARQFLIRVSARHFQRWNAIRSKSLTLNAELEQEAANVLVDSFPQLEGPSSSSINVPTPPASVNPADAAK